MIWYPIETAPKDGNIILGAWKHTGRDEWLGQVALTMRWYSDGWHVLPVSGNMGPYHPTHWMEVPRLP